MTLSNRVRRWLEDGERLGFRLAAKLVFLFLLALLITVSVAANSVLLAVLASFAVGLMLRAVLPADRFRTWVRSYWTGTAGDRWRRRFDRWDRRLRRMIPW